MKKDFLPKSTIISCFLAGCLEMYDFAIFGFFTVLLNKEYLSLLDKNNSLIITYALFAVGFIFRPIGSIVFGYIGDKYGRKPSLVISVTMMGIASLGMFLLPPYNMIGVSACYIIALVRIMQGLSVGGEYNGAILYAMEHTNIKSIGFVGAIVTAGSTLGVLLASFVSKILQNPSLPSYSWRFAFLIGFILSLIGYVIRKTLKESPLFNKELNNEKGIPLVKSFKFLKVEFLAAFLLSAANNANFYYLLIFIPNYLKGKVPFNIDNLGLTMTLTIFILVPFFGYISDKLGRSKIIISTCLTMAIYHIFLLGNMLSSATYNELLIYSLIGTIIMAGMLSSINIFVIEIFPSKYRFSNSALSYSLGAALFGGTVPMIASYILESTKSLLYLCLYISFISAFGAIGSIAVRLKNKRNSLIKEPELKVNH